jgi:pimeloyl-ACP methyl ester carboxylesterase
MHFTTFDGTTLSYVTIGKREQPPLLLIHGLGCDHLMWEPQLNHYYAQGLFVIAPDVRGHGLSSPVTTFRVHDCARDVVILLDHLGIERAHLAGVSMGGLIVQQVACDFPERVDRLVIADSYSEVRTPTEKLGGWANWLTIKFFPDMFAQSLKAAYQGPQKERALNYMLKAYDRMDKPQLLHARAAINRFNIRARLRQVESPALVLVGDQFGAFAIQMARKIADALPHAEFFILPDGCDPSNLVVPAQFDRAVLDFLFAG